MRRAERQGEAGRYDRHRGIGAGGAGGPADIAVLFTGRDHHDRFGEDRLDIAKKFGATHLISSTDGHAADHVMKLTGGAGVDAAIEAVGLPVTFDICQGIIAPGGCIANVGVHGKPVELRLQKL